MPAPGYAGNTRICPYTTVEMHFLFPNTVKSSSRRLEWVSYERVIRQKSRRVPPSPRFAESAQQNGEKAGERCLVFILGCC